MTRSRTVLFAVDEALAAAPRRMLGQVAESLRGRAGPDGPTVEAVAREFGEPRRNELLEWHRHRRGVAR